MLKFSTTLKNAGENQYEIIKNCKFVQEYPKNSMNFLLNCCTNYEVEFEPH